jgi:hypothetical protein
MAKKIKVLNSVRQEENGFEKAMKRLQHYLKRLPGKQRLHLKQQEYYPRLPSLENRKPARKAYAPLGAVLSF